MASTVATAWKDCAVRTAYQLAKSIKYHCLGDNAPRKDQGSAMIFLREFCKKPRAIGAVCPSSRRLARTMASRIPSGDGLIVELGAGTGMVTREIAHCLDDPKRLWAVEQSDNLATLLARTMPQINVIQGDARELSHIVPPHRQVDMIISSLPLRAFSRQDVEAITRQWAAVLAPGGAVVQFTYALWGGGLLSKKDFYESEYSVVWQNFPPARVQVLKKHD